MSHKLYLHFDIIFCAFGSVKICVTIDADKDTLFIMYLVLQNKAVKSLIKQRKMLLHVERVDVRKEPKKFHVFFE
jgi:hypothetical protein